MRTLRTLRTLVALVALVTLVPLRTLLTLDTLESLDTLFAGLTLLARLSGITLRALVAIDTVSAVGSGRTSGTFRSILSIYAGQSSLAPVTLFPIRSSFAGVTLRSLATLSTTNLTDVCPPGATPNMKMAVRVGDVALTHRPCRRKIIDRGDSAGDSDRATILTRVSLLTLLATRTNISLRTILTWKSLWSLLTRSTIGPLWSLRTLRARISVPSGLSRLTLVALRRVAHVGFPDPPIPVGADVRGNTSPGDGDPLLHVVKSLGGQRGALVVITPLLLLISHISSLNK